MAVRELEDDTGSDDEAILAPLPPMSATGLEDDLVLANAAFLAMSEVGIWLVLYCEMTSQPIFSTRQSARRPTPTLIWICWLSSHFLN